MDSGRFLQSPLDRPTVGGRGGLPLRGGVWGDLCFLLSWVVWTPHSEHGVFIQEATRGRVWAVGFSRGAGREGRLRPSPLPLPPCTGPGRLAPRLTAQGTCGPGGREPRGPRLGPALWAGWGALVPTGCRGVPPRFPLLAPRPPRLLAVPAHSPPPAPGCWGPPGPRSPPLCWGMAACAMTSSCRVLSPSPRRGATLRGRPLS